MPKLLTFLEGEVPLTKTFSRDESGEIVKVGHPKIINYVSHDQEVSSIEDMYVATLAHAGLNHCMLKGNVTRPLHWESRAGTTDQNAPTWWLCLDLDGHKHVRDTQDFMDTMGMGDVDRIDQYSASSGVLPDRGLSAHVLVMLDREVLPGLIKQWLIARNFSISGLRSSIGLSRTGNALRWPLDITTCQNDKLIYVAPPLLEDGVVDGFTGDRIQLIKRAKRLATIDVSKVSAEANKIEVQKTLDLLRSAAGLEKRKADRTRVFAGVEYMPKPDVSTVNGIREEKDFVYLNLNGGDSWGYWHPRSNPEFIYNWKGEPTYRTSELVPDYWQSVRRTRRESTDSGVVHLAFRDFRTSGYYNGTYDLAEHRLELAQAKSTTQLRDFLVSRGQPVPDAIPDMDVVYDPMASDLVDLEAKPRPQVNGYQASELERRLKATPEEEWRKHTACPQEVRDVLAHAINDDSEFLDYTLNWFATIVQHKVATGVAHVWHGVPGTGKGLMYNDVITPILGPHNTQMHQMKALASDFNGWIEGCQFVYVDEVQMSAMGWESKALEAKIKHYVTEPYMMVVDKFAMPRKIKNYLNMLFPSNKPDPVLIDPNDRRFAVAKFQERKLPMTTEGIKALRDAVWPFYCYLMQYPADRERARTPLNTLAKQLMIDTNMSSLDHVTRALKEGNHAYFVEQKPDPIPESLSSREREAAVEYSQLVDKMVEYKSLKREELYIIFGYVVGDQSPAPGKFGQLLRHRGIEFEPCRRGDEKQFRGFKVNWRA